MDKQETLKGIRRTRQVLAECVENGMLDGFIAWKLQRALQIAEGAVSRTSLQDSLFQGMEVNHVDWENVMGDFSEESEIIVNAGRTD